jgi:hypothetical protein
MITSVIFESSFRKREINGQRVVSLDLCGVSSTFAVATLFRALGENSYYRIFHFDARFLLKNLKKLVSPGTDQESVERMVSAGFDFPETAA